MSQKPKNSTYYGVPLYFRTEQRKKRTVFVLSYRTVQSGKLRIEYEHPPRRIPELEELLARSEAISDNSGSTELTVLEQIPDRVMEDFFGKFLDTNGPPEKRARGITRRDTLPDLTLGALLAADRDLILQGDGGSRKQSTIDDDLRTIQILRQNAGSMYWREVTPGSCTKWLARLPLHRRISCRKIMRRLLLHYLEMELIDSLLGWESYDPVGAGRPPENYTSELKNNILQTMLTYGQCAQLTGGISDSAQANQISGVDMAFLLRMTLGLSYEELCGLNLEDFRYLNDYRDRLTVNIARRYEKAESRRSYHLTGIQDVHRRRKLPLPHLCRDCFKIMRKNRSSDNTRPLIQTKGSRRRMTPEELKREFAERLKPMESFLRIGSKVYKPDLHKFLSNTAERELRKSGCEEEELRFIFGKPPKIVSAKYYADYMNEAELNKLGALMDHWLNQVISQPRGETTASRLEKKSGSVQWSVGRADALTQASISISLDSLDPGAIPEDGILLQLSSLRGFSGSVTYQTNCSDSLTTKK